MKITRIESCVLLDSSYSAYACSSAQDDVIVEIHTDEGIVGIGEVDANPWVVRALIHSPGTHVLALGLEEMLVGEDPLQVEALWEKMYHGSLMTGRRGVGVCAIGALDMELWDIRGKALGLPCWQLLGGSAQERITPYASVLPDGRNARQYQDSLVEKLKQAQRAGFRAAKAEVCIKGQYSHNGLQESDEVIVEMVAACREAVGPGFVLMVDVVYAWRDARQALRVLTALEPYDLFFVETPLSPDDLEGHAFLHDRSPIRIASGELLTTRFEFLDLIERGKVDVVQPDIGRVGGLTEARRVCQIAADRGRLVVPHCWKTGIGIAASAHLAAATPNCPYMEFLPLGLSQSPLRRDVTRDEPELEDGTFRLPVAPGLGIELNRSALKKYEALEVVS
jgi:L-rhamnonate dehydratase